ncbi:DUF4132 domain-containing protein [Planomonospora sp. ID67723]|uniref:DUF4132 domain-containing protein n=1 Tax=Planomonospora sp. ID67723 TaxID=2738134 RepID=UPI0018C3E5B7|nr:DUF4132 domain-containing protein [Planomonospora sp. ID67723]MBG0831649.1 DUF4132 domain-containing protein [Planomonospora sp. ID67723]
MGVIGGLPDGLRGWLDGLDEATLEMFRRLDATLRPQDAYHFADDTLLKELSAGWGEVEWRTTALWAQLLTRTTDGSIAGERLLTRLAQRKLRWTPQERELLWRTTLTPPEQYWTEVCYRIPISSIKGLPASERESLLPYLMWAQREMEATPISASWAAKRLLDDLLAEHLADDPAEATRSLVPEGDGFAVLLREEYGKRLGESDALPLLRHWATATSATSTAQWTARAAELLTPRTVELMREILGRVPTYREGPWHNGYREVVTYLRERTAELLRGMIWTCELIDEPWVTGLLGEVALATSTGIGGSGPNSRSERVANAALGVLARRGGTEAVTQLARIQAKVRRKSILAKVKQILEAIAAQTGLSPEQLLERTVPTFGLDHDGTRTERGLTLSVTGAITCNGRKTIPRSVDRELLAEFKATAKELKKTIPAERFRVERALASERTWPWQEACAFYLDHPVTGAFARNLIWEIIQGPAGLPVRVDRAWELTDPTGHRIQPRPDTLVRLWHPISHTADEVRTWRDHLLAIGLRQPFKQAFREVYLLTPAEEVTRDHSRRFSDHLLRYGQAKALLTERGWSGMSLGHWDAAGGSGQCTAAKELPGGLTARWDFHLDEHSYERDGYGTTVSMCVSGDLCVRAGTSPVPLAEVAPLILSETLRDADLAVGVTSTGLDPEGHGDYWQSYGFGELTETARTRRDALARLLPRLKIADRAELTDRFLRVRGDLRTYKIHLGSGNILMEPNDAYLCIVPGRDRDTGSVFLPFEEDGGMLSVILSKAFLLAADTAITDLSITHQLTG